MLQLPHSRRPRRVLSLAAGCVLACAPALMAQQAAIAAANRPARQVLRRAIEALGGPAYLAAKNKISIGRVYTFNIEGQMNGYGNRFWSYSRYPGDERIELTRKRNVVFLYLPGKAWEISYRGPRVLNIRAVRAHHALIEHSIGVVLRQWFRDPRTLLIYKGEGERKGHQVERVDLINDKDDSVHLSCDINTGLPVQVSWRQRDPILGSFVKQTEVFGHYQRVRGIVTPMVVQRYSGKEPVMQEFLSSVRYVPALPARLFTPVLIKHKH